LNSFSLITFNFLVVFRLLILILFVLPIVICICAYIRIRCCFESTSMVDVIYSMFRDYCCKYSPFISPLFVGAKMEVNEGLEFTTSPTNGRSYSIETNVRVDGVARLLVSSIKLCLCFNLLISSVPTFLCSTKPLYLILLI
jgi:hypothetical protein